MRGVHLSLMVPTTWRLWLIATKRVVSPFPRRLTGLRLRAMTRDQMIAHLRAADAVARDAVAHGHHPFGAVLVGPDDAILMRQGNIDTVHHAETELARRAAAAYLPEFLWTCTLVSTGEP